MAVARLSSQQTKCVEALLRWHLPAQPGKSQHAVRLGTCGLRLTQPMTSTCPLCVHIGLDPPSLCEAGRSMWAPAQARCERFVLLPARATVRTDSQFAKACSRTCTIHFVRVQLQPCDQTTAVWPRLCVRGVTLDTDSPLCLVRSGRCGERPKRATGLSGACASGWVRVCVRVLRRACAHTPCCGLDRAAREAAMRSVSEPVTR